MTIAEEICEKGVDALDSASKKRIEELHKIIEPQVKALEECKSAVLKLDKGEKLTRQDRNILATVVGLSPTDLEIRHKADPDPERLERFFKTPEAYFYVAAKDKSMLKVYLRAGEPVRLIADTDEEYT